MCSVLLALNLKLTSLPSLGSESVDAYMLRNGKGVIASLVQQGLMPCTPFNPSFAVSMQVLELYWNSHLRCPHLAIQPFVKGLCDLQGISVFLLWLGFWPLHPASLLSISQPAVQHLLWFVSFNSRGHSKTCSTCPQLWHSSLAAATYLPCLYL